MQLPADVQVFTGRQAEMSVLDALLAQAAPAGATGQATADPAAAGPAGPRIVAVTGTGGVGKTALVVHWAHRVRDQFPDGQLYVNLRGYDPDQPVAADTALAGFLHAVGAGQDIPADLESRAAAYRSLLDGRRMLVVLDNASSAAQVRPLLPGTSQVMTVITSRDQLAPLAVDGARTLQLDLLPPAESSALLAGRIGPDRVAAEPAAAEQIAAACAGLPLAMVVVAARAATSPSFPLSVLAADLAGTGHRLDALTAGDALSDVRAVFSWSYQELPPLVARAWRQLSLHPGPDLTGPAAASLTGLPLATVRPLLVNLTQANLLTEHRPGRYAWHDLLLEYATELAWGIDAGPQRDAAIRRMLDHYTHTAHAAARRLYPARDRIFLPLTRPVAGADPGQFDDADQAMDWFAAEHHVLVSAQRLAASAGYDTIAWQLAWCLSTFLRRAGHWHDRMSMWRTALATAEHLGNPSAQAWAHRMLGQSLHLIGAGEEDVEVHLESAFALFDQAGDRLGEADTCATVVSVCSLRGQFDRALEFAYRGATCYEALGIRAGMASCFNSIGWNLVQLGRDQEALGWCERALPIQEEVGFLDLGTTWDTLGVAHHHLGDYEQAVRCYQQAVDSFRHIGDRPEEAGALARLGDTLLAVGQPDEARASWQQALAILTDLGHPDAADVQARLTQATSSTQVTSSTEATSSTQAPSSQT